MEVFGYVPRVWCPYSDGREEARRKIREQKRAERNERIREKIEPLKARS